MEIVTRYIADDGKEFVDKGECMHYEAREKAKVASESNHLIMFDEQGVRTDNSDRAWFAYFKTERAREIFYDAVLNDIGDNPGNSEDIKQRSDPNETDMIFWNEDKEEWICVKPFLRFAGFMHEIFKEYLD